MLAIEHHTLPPLLVGEVQLSLRTTNAGLPKLLKSGRKAGVLRFDTPAAEVARTLFAALEGAMLSACAFGDFDRFNAAAAWQWHS